MRLDDRISIKTVNTRHISVAYQSEPCRFGSSDAVSLVSMKTTIEVMTASTAGFVGCALSRNPEHELDPPGAIDEFFLDESLYARTAWATSYSGTGVSVWSATKEIDLHGIIVPNRQIHIAMIINGSNATGLTSEIYFRNVELSRQETDLLNITWGKYRR